MIKQRPLQWLDITRFTPGMWDALREAPQPVMPVEGDAGKAFGVIAPRYPTPQELFFWAQTERQPSHAATSNGWPPA